MGPQGIAGVVGAPGPMVSIGHLTEYVPLYNVNNLIAIFFIPLKRLVAIYSVTFLFVLLLFFFCK